MPARAAGKAAEEKGIGEKGVGERLRRGRGILGGASGMGNFGWSVLSDFTNEMDKCCETDRVGNNGHRALCFLKLPSVAIFP